MDNQFQLEHIDPCNSKLVCGLKNKYNEIIADGTYNRSKSNRFVPYRICSFPAPVTFGDMGEFLIKGDWVICEFGGETWIKESKRLGDRTSDATEQMRQLGLTSKHKRNTSIGTAIMSGPNKRQYMRKHWRKEVWDAVKEKWENRTSFHWGKTSISRRYGVSIKTLDNMLDLIIAGVDWPTATNWNEDQ